MQQTMAVGSLSLAVSRLAEQKARFPKLREFAQFEAAEQETVADILKSSPIPGLVNGTVTHPSEAELEEHLDSAGRETLQKMRSAQAGAMFDRAYLDAQTDGHQQLLRIQEDYLRSGGNPDNINVAKLARGMIKEHLQVLADIKMEMGPSTTGAEPGRR
jgi:putative membrane protein